VVDAVPARCRGRAVGVLDLAGAFRVGRGAARVVGHLLPLLDGAAGPRVGVAGPLDVAVVPVVADGTRSGCGGGGDGDELRPVAPSQVVGDQPLDHALEAVGLGVGEQFRAQCGGAQQRCRVLRWVVVDESLARLLARGVGLDAFAFGLHVERAVLAGVRATGLWIQVVVVDATLQSGRVEEHAGVEPRRIGVERRGRFRRLPEADVEHRPAVDGRKRVAVDRDAVLVGKEPRRQRVAVAPIDERSHLVASQRDEIRGPV